jgi:hypothetical protein
MYREYERELTDAEREALMARIANPTRPESWRWTLKWGTIWFVAMLVCLAVMGAIMTFLDSRPAIGGPLVGIVGVAGIIFLYCFIMVIGQHRASRGYVRHFLHEDVPAIRRTLDHGKVGVKHVVATSVMELTEYEDEGSVWLFDIGEGRALLCPEMWFFDEDESWPNSDFGNTSAV